MDFSIYNQILGDNKNEAIQVFCYLMLILLTYLAEAIEYAKKGCIDTCGEVMIPFPLGIASNCSLNEWYMVDCNASTPYLYALDNLEVLSINLEEQTVTVNVSQMSHFRNNNHIPSVDLGDGPFVFSESHNIFTVAGCGTAAILEDREVISGCSTTCNNDTTIDESILCFGINCCQTTIRHDIKSYSVDITRLKKKCEAGGSAFLVDKNSKQGRFPGEFVFKGDNSFIPICGS